MASKIKKHRRREATAPAASVTDKIPLVSVIIPMYNSAKFITQTLESLTYQTMRDFEVVVVDDCSTDNSVEVVEHFANRVGGGLNLHVIKLPKNTGTPGLPRNVGIQFARGKYIAFLDSDDLYTKTALEELTTLAEKYQADVIQTGSVFNLWDGIPKSIDDDPEMTDMKELLNPRNFTLKRPNNFASNEFFLSNEHLEERLKLWLASLSDNTGLFSSFCARDFLVAEQILFKHLYAGEDQVFNFACLCMAKNFLYEPNAFYIVRQRKGSIMRETFSNPESYFRKRVSAFKNGLTEINNVMDRLDFFTKHFDYRYAVLDKYAWMRLGATFNFFVQVSPLELYPLVKGEFIAEESVPTAYLFNTVNIQRLQLMQLHRENIALRNELQKYQTVQ